MRTIHVAALSLVLSGFVVSAVATAQGEPSAPPGCNWQSIPEVKVHLALPDGWTLHAVVTGSETSYEVAPGGPQFKATPSARFWLIVRHVKPEAAVGMARAAVDSIANSGSEPAATQEHAVSVLKTFAAIAHKSAGSTGQPGAFVAASATANSVTGALYSIRFDIPESEWQSVWQNGASLFAGARLDDEF